MNRPQNQRRGVVVGLSALAGLTAAALSIVVVTQHSDAAAQQQDVALTNVYSDLVDSQAAHDHSLFTTQVINLQESFYNKEDGAAWLHATGSPPDTSVFNGAWTRFFEGQEVSQALQQAHVDQLLNVNAHLGDTNYQTLIGSALYSDISGSGVQSGTPLDTALAPFQSPGDLSDAAFHSDLVALHAALLHNVIGDLLGMFSAHAADAAADTVAALDVAP